MPEHLRVYFLHVIILSITQYLFTYLQLYYSHGRLADRLMKVDASAT